MSTPLFDSKLKAVKNNQELQEVIKDNPNYDPAYVACACSAARKTLLESLWPPFERLADKKFLKQIKTSFHQCAWEMYIGNVLLNIFEPEDITSKDSGPDFVINGKLYVECVCPTKGDPKKNPDTVPEMVVEEWQVLKGDPSHIDNMVKLRLYGYDKKKPEEIEELKAACSTSDRIKMRVTQAIREKVQKYEGWAKNKIINTSLPYVIAVSMANIGYIEDHLMPYGKSALFGTDSRIVDPNLGIESLQGWSFTPYAKRVSGEKISFTDFLSDKYKMVSGVLYSNESIIDHLSDENRLLVLIDNPFADHPLPVSFQSHFIR